MAEPIAGEEQSKPTASGINVLAIVVALIILIPLNYALFVKIFPSSPPAAEVPVTPPPVTADAIEAAMKTVAATPNLNSYLSLGLAYYNAKNYEEAIKAWQKALEYDPQNAMLYNNIGSAYGSIGKLDEEIAACTKAISLKPDFELARRNLNWAEQQKRVK